MKYFPFLKLCILFFYSSICLADVDTSNGGASPPDILRIMEQIDKEADSYIQNTARVKKNINVDYRENPETEIKAAVTSKYKPKPNKYTQIQPQSKKISKRKTSQVKIKSKDINKIIPAKNISTGFDKVTALMNKWANSWSKGNADEHINFYTNDFSPINKSRKHWIVNRKQLIKPGRKIKINISKVKLKVVNRGKVISSQFVQKFSSGSYTNISKKELIWKNLNGNWLISLEKTIK